MPEQPAVAAKAISEKNRAGHFALRQVRRNNEGASVTYFRRIAPNDFLDEKTMYFV